MLKHAVPFAAALILISALPSLSQVTEQDNAVRTDTALRLAKVLNPPDTYEQRQKEFAAAIAPMFAAIEKQSGAGALPPMSADQINKVMDDVRPSYESWTHMFAQAYAAHFTVDEMTDMIRFYSSPTGMKMQSIMPRIGSEMMQQEMAELLPKLQQVMRKQGLLK